MELTELMKDFLECNHYQDENGEEVTEIAEVNDDEEE